MWNTVKVEGNDIGSTEENMGAVNVSLDGLDSISFDLPRSGELEYECEHCNTPISDQGGGEWVTPDDVLECDDSDDGLHHARRIPLEWANSAGVSISETRDEVCFYISTGDPRGAMTFTVRRADDGSIRIIMPSPEDSQPHEKLARLSDSMLVVVA